MRGGGGEARGMGEGREGTYVLGRGGEGAAGDDDRAAEGGRRGRRGREGVAREEIGRAHV